ncbi:MAG: DUF3261 domain-containing protein [Deltaproteobacteria bacterium]|nr:DUF3261 domain-containing protein [Deltaproteobacteria bacterium]
MKHLAILLAFLALLGCSGQPLRPPVLTDAMYPWPLRPPTALGTNFLWQQRLTARVGPRSDSLPVAVQKQGDTLTMIGLTPFNTKAFLLTQTGDAIDFKKFVDRDLPFPPRYVLVDFQRTWLALGPSKLGPLPGAGTLPEDGKEITGLDGEVLTQRVQGGKLVERQFVRLGTPGEANSPPLTIRYSGYRPDGLPGKVVLTNRWFGYELEIETLAAQPLP